MKELILASASPARRALLQRLHLSFQCIPASIPEDRRIGEATDDYVRRLAAAKAEKIAAHRPQAVVIGCDEVAVSPESDHHLGKPGDHATARQYLQQLSGSRVRFLTALCVLSEGVKQQSIACTQVKFRALSPAMIEHYLKTEKPYHCAAAFMSETLGVALCSAVVEDEPGALMGLPFISLCDFLTHAGVVIFPPPPAS